MKETLNLLPVEVKAGDPAKKGKFYYFFLALALYSAAAISLWAINIVNIRKVDAEISSLNKQREELQLKFPRQSGLPVVASSIREIADVIERSPRWSSIISDISVVVPEEVWFSSIESRDDKNIKYINIKGLSTTQFGVAKLISALEKSRYFYDVEIIFSQKGEKDISFELKTKLKWI